MPLRAVAEVDLGAIERNVALLRSRLAAGAQLCAVVKADGYGHGAVAAARAAQAGGAGWLAVATAGEAVQLREGGIGGRILVMGALSSAELIAAVEVRAEIVAWSPAFVGELSTLIGGRPELTPVPVHVKLDTGMGRLGSRRPDEVLAVAEAIRAAAPMLTLAGLMTHFATSDEDDDGFLREQLGHFRPLAEELRRRAPGIVVHAANSGATLRAPDSHFDLVRCGIAIYGGDPANRDPAIHGLEPALSLRSYVAAVKPIEPGESAGYGRRFIADRATTIATLPIGYADGVRRAFTNNADVLIAGRRYPLVGTVSMDNITVDVGPETTITPGVAATLIGRDGEDRLTAEEQSQRIGTINYELLCGIGARVPRAHLRTAPGPRA